MLVEDGRQRFGPPIFNVRIAENPFFGAVVELKTSTSFEGKVQIVFHEHECGSERFFVIGTFVDGGDFFVHRIAKVSAACVYDFFHCPPIWTIF